MKALELKQIVSVDKMPIDLFQSIQSELLAALIVGGLSYLLGRGTEFLIKTIKQKQGSLAGNWIQKIYDPESMKLVKVDQVKCKHMGEKVEAEIIRILPEKDKGRSWFFRGEFVGIELFGTFKNKKGRIPSHGNILMHLVADENFKGHYSKSNFASNNKEMNEFLLCTKQIPLEWEFGIVPQKELKEIMEDKVD